MIEPYKESKDVSLNPNYSREAIISIVDAVGRDDNTCFSRSEEYPKIIGYRGLVVTVFIRSVVQRLARVAQLN